MTLELVDSVPPQVNSSDAAAAFSPPFAVNGALLYARRDALVPEVPAALVRNGQVQIFSGEFISGNQVSSIAVVHTDGVKALVGAFSNFASPTPNTSFLTLNVFEGSAFTRILSRGSTLPGYPEPPHPGNPVGLGTISGNRVAFMIREHLGPPRLPTAIAVSDSGGGAVQIIAKEGDPAPAGGNFGTFASFVTPYIYGEVVVFPGTAGSVSGIYRWSPADGLSRLVAGTDPRPEGGTFINLASHRVLHDGATVLFHAVNNSGGIYRVRGGVVDAVVTGQVPIPAGQGNFSRVSDPSLRAGRVVFKGSRSDFGGFPAQTGIYVESNGQLHRVVDQATDFGPGLVPVDFKLGFGGAWLDDSTVGFTVVFANHASAVYRAGIQWPPRTLPTDFVRTSARAGRFLVPSQTGHRYELLRSTTLLPGDEAAILTIDGTGGELPLAFDDEASTDTQAFFWVRETPLATP